MEFTDPSRFIETAPRKIVPFSMLRTLPPVAMTQDLRLVEEPDNRAWAKSLADQGLFLVPIRRRPASATHAERVSFPRRVILEMTSRCNFLCRMCPQQNLKRPRMDMPGALYRNVIDQLDQLGIEGLWLYHLGESLLHPEFRDNIRHISTKKNLGIIWLSTNGQHFNEENIRCVLGSNIDYLNFSAHAVTAETYATVSQLGDFKTVQANLDRFCELKGGDLPRRPFLHCQMIEQATTRHEVDAFLQAHARRAEIVSVNMLEYVNLPNNQFGLAQRERKPLTSCLRVLRNDCFICSNGDVTLCDAAYNGEILLGNVAHRPLHDLWNGEERRRIIELNAAGRMAEVEFCSACTDYDI